MQHQHQDDAQGHGEQTANVPNASAPLQPNVQKDRPLQLMMLMLSEKIPRIMPPRLQRETIRATRVIRTEKTRPSPLGTKEEAK